MAAERMAMTQGLATTHSLPTTATLLLGRELRVKLQAANTGAAAAITHYRHEVNLLTLKNPHVHLLGNK